MGIWCEKELVTRVLYSEMEVLIITRFAAEGTMYEMLTLFLVI